MSTYASHRVNREYKAFVSGVRNRYSALFILQREMEWLAVVAEAERQIATPDCCSRRERDALRSLLSNTHNATAQRFFQLINEHRRNQPLKELHLLTDLSSERFVIYTLCQLLGLRTRRITREGTKRYSSLDYDGPLPHKITKYGPGMTSYDGDELIYTLPYTYKIGVTAFAFQ